MQSTMNDICPSSNITCMQPSSLNKNPTTHANSHVSSDTSALTHSDSTSDISLIEPRVILPNSDGSKLCVSPVTSDSPQRAPVVPRFGEQISPRRRERNSTTPPLLSSHNSPRWHYPTVRNQLPFYTFRFIKRWWLHWIRLLGWTTYISQAGWNLQFNMRRRPTRTNLNPHERY